MNDRERFIATLMFQQPAQIPFYPGHGRRSTYENWYRQGLPANVTDIPNYVRQLLQLPECDPPPNADDEPSIVMTMRPEFSEKIIEQRTHSKIVQDWKGNLCEIGNEFNPSDLRGAPDFVTRSWLKCPVTSREDWPDMARRYDPNDPARFPVDFPQRSERLKNRTREIGLSFSGPFWQLREWLGFESLCMLLIDDPDFAKRMIDFWCDYVSHMLEKTFAHFIPDYVMINEDMAYKEKPMIGPDMCREFLLPCWTQWGQIIRNVNVPIYCIDSDGYIADLIPVWLEAGVNYTCPLEVAAGNDLSTYRQQFNTLIAYSGGVDKRAIAAGGHAIQREMDRLQPIIDAGGYIPSCDHGVPSNVTWPNFLTYCQRLAQATGWV